MMSFGNIVQVIGTAIDDRCHSDVVHLAKAVSIRDLRDEVQEQCPDDTSIIGMNQVTNFGQNIKIQVVFIILEFRM